MSTNIAKLDSNFCLVIGPIKLYRYIRDYLVIYTDLIIQPWINGNKTMCYSVFNKLLSCIINEKEASYQWTKIVVLFIHVLVLFLFHVVLSFENID